MVVGCSLETPDVEVCVVLPTYRAACKYTISGDERILTAEEWYDAQVGRFTLSAEGFAKYQTFVKLACERMKCSLKERRAFVAFEGEFIETIQRGQK